MWSAAELGVIPEFSGSGVDGVVTVAAVRVDDAPAISEGDMVVRIDPL